ncbi:MULTISPECIES: hypothetical protein [Luteimonas]|nr:MULTISPECIES: hypothetical protein [Luteimonas]
MEALTAPPIGRTSDEMLAELEQRRIEATRARQMPLLPGTCSD